MAKPQAFGEFVGEKVNEHKFCVAMCQKLFRVSHSALYYCPISPHHLGGKWMKLNPKPAIIGHERPLKTKETKNLLPMADLQETECCKRVPRCTSKLLVEYMAQYRERHQTANQVTRLHSQ